MHSVVLDIQDFSQLWASLPCTGFFSLHIWNLCCTHSIIPSFLEVFFLLLVSQYSPSPPAAFLPCSLALSPKPMPPLHVWWIAGRGFPLIWAQRKKMLSSNKESNSGKPYKRFNNNSQAHAFSYTHSCMHTELNRSQHYHGVKYFTESLGVIHLLKKKKKYL